MVVPQMKYEVNDSYIDVFVPLTSQGKFRCKYRDHFQEYGKSFGPKSTLISKNSYVEWQIGYDVKVNDDSKTTALTNLVFVGANGKNKNPYELSEIFYYACKIGLISKNEVEDLINFIENIKEFLQDMYPIKAIVEGEVEINNVDFFKSVITLPTFNMLSDSCSIVSEITIQKQQYATGVQPMLYMDIPMLEFLNSNEIIGNNSSKIKYGILRLDKHNIDVIKNLFLCFGMCSSAHNHDVLEILKKIREDVFR